MGRVPHRPRAEFRQRFPLHVTLRLRAGLPSLRRVAPYRVLCRSLGRGCEKVGFRVVEYSVQTNHVHLVVEGADRSCIARGMQGLCVRIARGLNRLWGRRGSVFADRYHDVVLRTPRQVRHALLYVLQNCRRHGVSFAGADPYSSGPWFDGWVRAAGRAGTAGAVACGAGAYLAPRGGMEAPWAAVVSRGAAGSVRGWGLGSVRVGSPIGPGRWRLRTELNPERFTAAR